MGRDPYPEGKKVVVVGGGNVAMDCVRSSFRIGQARREPRLRRTKAEMPADPVEIHDAEEEGVNFHYLCNPTRIIEKDGKVVAVELHKDGAWASRTRAGGEDQCPCPARSSSWRRTYSYLP